MRIVLIKESGAPPAAPLEALFTEQGGTIGRGPDCTLVLPDPFRHVSRVQAEITYQSGQWVLTDKGSVNSFSRGGLEFGRNKQTVLNDQDVLTLGEYELRIEFSDSLAALPATSYNPEPVAASAFWSGIATKPSASNHPFDDLFPPASDVHSSSHAASSLAGGSKAVIPDDFDIFAPLPANAARPQEDRFGQVFNAPQTEADASGYGGAQSGTISDNDSLDKLFDLRPNQLDSQNLQGPSIDDPLAGFVPSNASIDAFGLAPAKPLPAAAPQQRQDAPEINTPFILPRAAPTVPTRAIPNIIADFSAPEFAAPQALQRVDASPQRAQPSPQPVEPNSVRPKAAPIRAIPASIVAPEQNRAEDDLRAIANAAVDQHQARIAPSLDEPFTATLAGINRQTGEAIRKEAIAKLNANSDASDLLANDSKANVTFNPIPVSGNAAPAGVAAPAAAAKARSIEVPPMSDEQFELLKQLLIGLGLSELPKSQASGVQAPSALTPELMFRMGQLIKISTHGVLEMLEARNLLKREMKAEVTMILKGGNNPLKFSPDALGAVAHLLSPHGVRGFMQPVEALQDAFDDLLAHQVGFVAGMRAATEALVQRFDPKLLEQRLEKKSLVETVIPAKRKSKLWERYEELYGEIKAEAEDDFEALFGREFVSAYEAQVEQIKMQRQERG